MAKIVKKLVVKEVNVYDFRKLVPFKMRTRVEQMSNEELLDTPYSDLGISIAYLGCIYEDLLKKRGVRYHGKCMNEDEFHRGESDSRRWAESFARLSKDKTVRAILCSVNCA